jgi:hypothetical protein
MRYKDYVELLGHNTSLQERKESLEIEAKKPVLCFLKTSRLRLKFCCREPHPIEQDIHIGRLTYYSE